MLCASSQQVSRTEDTGFQRFRSDTDSCEKLKKHNFWTIQKKDCYSIYVKDRKSTPTANFILGKNTFKNEIENVKKKK